MFLTFDTQEKADTALKVINKNKNYPVIGRNALTGELMPHKQQTLRWAFPLYNNGKYYFEKPDEKDLTGVKDYIESNEIQFNETKEV